MSKTIASYRLSSREMEAAAGELGCKFLIPHTGRRYCWDWDGDPAVMVVNNSTDTTWWQYLADQAAAWCLIKGRLNWEPKWRSGNTQGQIAMYFGPDPASFQLKFTQFGACLEATA